MRLRCVIRYVTVLFAVVFVFGGGFCAYAEEQHSFTMDEQSDVYGDLYDTLGIDEMNSAVPDEAKRIIDEFELSPKNPMSFENLFSQNGRQIMLDAVKEYIMSPIKTAAVLLTAILLCAYVGSVGTSSVTSSAIGFTSFCSLVCMLLLLTPVTALISDCSDLLKTMSVFMNSLIPIYAGMLIAAARTGTALGFQTAVFAAAQTVGFIGTNVVTPFCSGFLALCAAGGASGEKRLFGIAEVIKRAAVWTMSIAMTVYISVFSIKNVISSTADGAGRRAARMLVSSFVPIVGTTVNEALSSMKGCVAVLCRSVGIYAIIIMLCVIVPVLFRLIFWRAMLSLCSAVSDMFCAEAMAGLLKSVASAVMVLTAVVICTALMFIFSLTVLTNAAN